MATGKGVEVITTEDEISRYRKRNPWRVDWYARNGTIRQSWFRTLREAREEAAKHKDAEVFKEIH